MSTMTTLKFLESTMHVLSILAEKSQRIRYDLIGSIQPSSPATPSTPPGSEFSPGDASFENGVEYFANRINTHLNHLDQELSVLRESVNHKPDKLEGDASAKAPY